MHGNKPHAPYAFSLIELCLTITIILVIITITLPKQSHLSKRILNQEVNNLLVTISYLRQKAIASNTTQELTFFNTNSYSFTQETKQIKSACSRIKSTCRTIKHKLHPLVIFGHQITNQSVLYYPVKGPPSSPRALIKKAITFPKNKIIFYPNGQVSPGTVYMTDISKKYLKALTCPISQVFFIRTYWYKNNKWIRQDASHKIAWIKSTCSRIDLQKNHLRTSVGYHSYYLDSTKQ